MQFTFAKYLLASLLSLPVQLAAGQVAAQSPQQPGDFDYYLLSLSWSPAYCAEQSSRNRSPQCTASKPHGFIVHGLWPQNMRGDPPASCSTTRKLAPDMVRGMLQIMPDSGLVQHQWRKHGTCSGLSPLEYFRTTRAAYEQVTIPAGLQPMPNMAVSAAEVERLFVRENPGLKASQIAMICKGPRVTEVRICLSRDLKFAECGDRVEDRCRSNARLTNGR